MTFIDKQPHMEFRFWSAGVCPIGSFYSFCSSFCVFQKILKGILELLRVTRDKTFMQSTMRLFSYHYSIVTVQSWVTKTNWKMFVSNFFAILFSVSDCYTQEMATLQRPVPTRDEPWITRFMLSQMSVSGLAQGYPGCSIGPPSRTKRYLLSYTAW